MMREVSHARASVHSRKRVAVQEQSGHQEGEELSVLIMHVLTLQSCQVLTRAVCC
jgi:hypothetical protein